MEHGRKPTVKILGIMMLVLLFIGVWFSAGSVTADAASTPYEQVYSDSGSAGELTKVGKYYFKFTYNFDNFTGKWSYSKKKTTGFKTIYKVVEGKSVIVTDGKNVYYLKNNKLYCYNISKKKTRMLKELPKAKNVYYSIGAAYGKNVYVNKLYLSSEKTDIYMYKTSSKKYRRIKKNFSIIDQYGKYVVGGNNTSSLRQCTLTSSGMSKGKKLATYGGDADFVNGKLYYVKYSNKSENKATLYRATVNGSKKKVLGTFSAPNGTDPVAVYDIHSTYCKVAHYGYDAVEYKYIYKTKKMKFIETF